MYNLYCIVKYSIRYIEKWKVNVYVNECRQRWSWKQGISSKKNESIKNIKGNFPVN